MQVYVEALVMEVTLAKSLNFGINWKAAGQQTITGFSAEDSQGGAFDTTSAAAASGTSNLGYLNANTISIGGTEFYSFGAFINATKGDTDVNILGNPQVLMMNNEEAVLNVSSNIPIGTKTVTDANQ